MIAKSFVSLFLLSQATLSLGGMTDFTQNQGQPQKAQTLPQQPQQDASQFQQQQGLNQFQFQPQQQVSSQQFSGQQQQPDVSSQFQQFQQQYGQQQPSLGGQGQQQQMWSTKPQPVQWPTNVNMPPQQTQPQPDQTQQPDQSQAQPDPTQPQPNVQGGDQSQGQAQPDFSQMQGSGNIPAAQRGQPFDQMQASAAAFSAPQVQTQTVAPQTQGIDLSQLQAGQYNKFPRQILPVQYTNPTYNQLPTQTQAAEIPHVKSQTTQSVAQTMVKPAQYQTAPTIQAPALYGKQHDQGVQQPQQ